MSLNKSRKRLIRKFASLFQVLERKQQMDLILSMALV